MLTPEEKTLTEILPEDKKQLILQEIKLLMVREYRMMKRIERMETATWNRSDSGEDASKEKGMADLLQSAEEALTRVQARQQKAIETLHMFGRDDARAELEAMKLEFEILKQGNQETEETDDGFLEAMNGAAQEVWKE